MLQNEDSDDDIYWPLELSRFATAIFHTLQNLYGTLEIKTDDDLLEFIDLVDPYKEFLRAEDVITHFETSKTKIATLDIQLLMLHVKEQLDILKAKELKRMALLYQRSAEISSEEFKWTKPSLWQRFKSYIQNTIEFIKLIYHSSGEE